MLAWWPFLLPGLFIVLLAFFDFWRSTDQPESYFALMLGVGLGVLAIGGLVGGVVHWFRQSQGRERRRLLFGIIVNGVVLIIMLVLAEGVLRFLGFVPYREPNIILRDDAGNRFWRSDPYLGFRLSEGTFRFSVTPQYAWEATHDASGHRRVPHAPASTGRRTLWVMGCSFTYGWSLNDADTVADRLQRLLPDWNIVCFALPGSGTTQAYLQLRRALEEGGKPDLVYYGYASFHETRNVLSRDRLRSFAQTDPNAIKLPPYARINPQGVLEIYLKPPAFSELPGMRWSGLIALIEASYDNIEMQWLPSQIVTWRLLHEMNRLCETHAAGFLVGTVTRDPLTDAFLAHAEQTKLATVPLLSADAEEGLVNLPFDGHPSAKAHRLYAERWLRSAVRRWPDRFADWQRAWAEASANRIEGNLPAAFESLRQCQAPVDQPAYTYERGLLQGSGGDYRRALESFRQVVALDPSFPEAGNALARMEALIDDVDLRRPGDALTKAERLTQGNAGNNAWFLETHALALASAGRWEQADEKIRQSIDQATAMQAKQTLERLTRVRQGLFERKLPFLAMEDVDGPLAP